MTIVFDGPEKYSGEMAEQVVATDIEPGAARLSVAVEGTRANQTLTFELTLEYALDDRRVEVAVTQWEAQAPIGKRTVITSSAQVVPKGAYNVQFFLKITSSGGAEFYVHDITDPDAWDNGLLLTEAEFAEMGLTVNGDIKSILRAASLYIEVLLCRKLWLDDYKFDQLLPDGNTVLLEAWPVTDVQSVTVDGQPDEHYELVADKGILMLSRHPGKRVTVEYTGGLSEIPMPIKQAVALIALAIDQNNETKGQALMSERLGDYQEMYYNQNATSNGYSAGRAFSVSPAAEALIAPYRGR